LPCALRSIQITIARSRDAGTPRRPRSSARAAAVPYYALCCHAQYMRCCSRNTPQRAFYAIGVFYKIVSPLNSERHNASHGGDITRGAPSPALPSGSPPFPTPEFEWSVRVCADPAAATPSREMVLQALFTQTVTPPRLRYTAIALSIVEARGVAAGCPPRCAPSQHEV